MNLSPKHPKYSKAIPIKSSTKRRSLFGFYLPEGYGDSKIISLFPGTENVEIQTTRGIAQDDFNIFVYPYIELSVQLSIISPASLALYGQSISAVSFRWTVSKTLTINDFVLYRGSVQAGNEIDISGVVSSNEGKTWNLTANLSTPVTADTNFIIVANDGTKEASSTDNILFGNHVIQAKSQAPSSPTGSSLITLLESSSDKTIQRDFQGTIQGYKEGYFVFYAFDATFDPNQILNDQSDPTWGFYKGDRKGGFYLHEEIMINNGYSSRNFHCYRSNYSSLYNVIVNVKK